MESKLLKPMYPTFVTTYITFIERCKMMVNVVLDRLNMGVD